MNQTLTIAKRELSSLFFSPIAYLVLAVFSLVAGMIFFMRFGPGQPAELRSEFGFIVWLMAFIVPAISMRLISEESRSGSMELLMTAPISDAQLVIGKWFGSFIFFVILLVPILFHILALEIKADPDYGPILTGLLGLLFVGALYLAIGIFISALTDSQLIAYIITVLITGFLTIGMYMMVNAGWTWAWLRKTMHYLNVDQQFVDFSKGLIDTSNFIYFISGVVLFLFLAVKVVESKRWR